jgi:hypothetical protein
MIQFSSSLTTPDSLVNGKIQRICQAHRHPTNMTDRMLERLTPTRKLLPAVVRTAAIAGTILIVAMNTPPSLAQSPAESLTFEVASVKPAAADAPRASMQFLPGGGLRVVNTPVRQVIALAYDVALLRVSGGPGWIDSDRFDILAKSSQPAGANPDTGPVTKDQIKQSRQRLQLCWRNASN